MPPWSPAPAARRLTRAVDVPPSRWWPAWRSRAALAGVVAGSAATAALAASAPPGIRARQPGSLPLPAPASRGSPLHATAPARAPSGAGAQAAAPIVVLDAARTGPNLERQHCLRVAIRPDVEVECGDLLIAHALPTTRRFTKDYTPVLLYNSRTATPYGRVVATISLPGGAPDASQTVSTILYIDGSPSPVVSRGWPASSWGPDGGARRIALNWNTTGYATGLHKFDLFVYATYGGSPTLTTSVTGEVAIVDRTNSWFGAGWWLDGWESLSLVRDGTNRILWIGGDGSTRVYRPVAANTWESRGMASVDTITTDGTLYSRHLPGYDGNRSRVVFDGFGRHYQTINRLGRVTTFGQDAVDSRRVASIVLPPYSPGQNDPAGYKFSYDGSGKLGGVCAPPRDGGGACKNTAVVVSGGNVQSIKAPDGSSESFGYQPIPSGEITSNAPSAPSLITSRIDPRGTPTSLQVGHAGVFLHADTYWPDPSGPTRHVNKFMWFDDEEVGSWGHGLPQPPEQVVTTFTDPRNNVTAFALDGHYQPFQIKNAVGERTFVNYDLTWPGLAASVLHPNGFSQLAFYNARGLADSTIDANPRGDGVKAITRYQWDPVFPFWTEIRSAENVVQRRAFYSRDGGRDGNLNWFQTGTDPSRRYTVGYNTLSLPGWVQGPADAAGAVSADSMWYDANGNLSDYHRSGVTATHLWNYYDGAPFRTYTKLDPGDDNWAHWRQVTTWRNQTTYRVDSTTTAGPARNGAPPETLRVATTYANDGLPLTVSRRSAPDPNAIGTLTTRYEYDGLGRRVTELAPDVYSRETTNYDPADNPTLVITRRNSVITMSYDALNRLTQRNTPAVSYAATDGFPTVRMNGTLADGSRSPGAPSLTYPGFPNDGGSGYVIAADVATFKYDSTGLREADNGDAHVSRSYQPDGRLLSETQALRTVGGNDFSQHVYTIYHQYDLDGRVTKVIDPTQLAAGSSQAATRYSYDYADPTRGLPGTGVLLGVLDLLNNSYQYTYDLRGRVTGLSRPGGANEAYAYDQADALTRDYVANGCLGGSGNYCWSEPDLRKRTFARDAEERMRQTTNTAGLADTLRPSYDALGHVVQSTLNSGARGFYGRTGTNTTNELFTYDAFANASLMRAETWRTLAGGGTLHESSQRTQGYEQGTGRHAYDLSSAQKDTFSYDPAGNIVWKTQASVSPGAPTAFSDRASYYGADEKLRAADARSLAPAFDASGSYQTVFEEYRYDALGRRVWVRARRWCQDNRTGQPSSTPPPAECGISKVRRTVWDGDAELWEIQMPGEDGAPEIDADVATVTRPAITANALSKADPNPYFGRVAYTHGLATDQPVSIARFGYGDLTTDAGAFVGYRSVAPFVISPLWNENGLADHGVFADGRVRNCQTTSNGPRCVSVSWPSLWYTYERDAGLMMRTAWHGSLLEDKRNAAGTLYRRNRVYDPATGRFTQEDPIGLAGGVNLYGFANGDPVNYGDPFGLMQCPPMCGGQSTDYLSGLANGVWDMFADRAAAAADAFIGLTPVGDARNAVSAYRAGAYGKSLMFAGMAAVSVVPGEAEGAAAMKVTNGMRATVGEALDLAVGFLGKGYKEVEAGRFVSSNGLRQVRMGANDILGRHAGGPHINFEVLAPNPGKPGRNMITDNFHVFLTDR